MAKGLTPAMPTPEIVRGMLPGSGYTGTALAIQMVRLPFNLTSTATASGTAGLAWINPETGTVRAKPFLLFRTAGTGTCILGVSSDGTGSNNNILLAATLAQGVLSRATTGTPAAGTAGEAGGWFLIGPGGTGTNNSIVMQHSDTVTSTMAGELQIEYVLGNG